MNVALQNKFGDILKQRGISYEFYVQTLAEARTSGFEMSLLALCEIFRVAVLLLFDKYLWKSEEIDLENFNVYMVMFAHGKIMSAQRRDKQKLVVHIPECLQNIVGNLRENSTFYGPELQPTNKRKSKSKIPDVRSATSLSENSDIRSPEEAHWINTAHLDHWIGKYMAI